MTTGRDNLETFNTYENKGSQMQPPPHKTEAKGEKNHLRLRCQEEFSKHGDILNAQQPPQGNCSEVTQSGARNSFLKASFPTWDI